MKTCFPEKSKKNISICSLSKKKISSLLCIKVSSDEIMCIKGRITGTYLLRSVIYHTGKYRTDPNTYQNINASIYKHTSSKLITVQVTRRFAHWLTWFWNTRVLKYLKVKERQLFPSCTVSDLKKVSRKQELLATSRCKTRYCYRDCQTQ